MRRRRATIMVFNGASFEPDGRAGVVTHIGAANKAVVDRAIAPRKPAAWRGLRRHAGATQR